MTVIVRKIVWDTDGDEAICESLPEEIPVDMETLGVEDESDMDEILDAVSEYITNLTGFCHDGFVIDTTAQNMRRKK